MPALTESTASSEMTVAPSAPLELMWLMHNSEAKHELIGPYASQEAIRLRFGGEVRAFWADGVRGCTELVVLAHRSGTLLDLALDDFFERLDEAASQNGPAPSLLSESPEERKAVAGRLGRLRTDPDLRVRYRNLLASVWSAARGEWELAGRSAVVAESERWRQRLRDGAGFKELLQRQQIWKGRPQLDEISETAADDGRLILSPGWFYGEIHVIEMDGTLWMGRGIRPHDHREHTRAVVTKVSSEMKALADPTRLAILMWLAQEASSVTEIARHFELSQPTVSGHVQLLREAGLLEEKSAGRSAKLSTSPESLRRFFGEAQDQLLNLCE